MLPLSRNTTYTPASPVKSADLNDVQDMIIGAKHGSITMGIDPCGGQAHGANADLNTSKVTWSGVDTWETPLLLPAGTRLTEIKAFISRDSGTAIILGLTERVLAGFGSIDDIVFESYAGGAGNQTVVVDTPASFSMPFTLQAGGVYALRMLADALDDLYGWEVTYETP